MPGNAFIKFTNQDGATVAGESLQETHKASDGWLEISDWSWDIEADTNFTKGTGASVGVAKPGTLSFTHSYDKSSPVIMQNIVCGTHFKTMHINMLKQVGRKDAQPVVYLVVSASSVFVTKVSSKGSEDGTITQDVDVVFKEVNVGYKRQTNQGPLDSDVKEFGWNIAEMTFQVGKDIEKLDFGALK
jgi:type VI secretion system secreted protein Hcp